MELSQNKLTLKEDKLEDELTPELFSSLFAVTQKWHENLLKVWDNEKKREHFSIKLFGGLGL